MKSTPARVHMPLNKFNVYSWVLDFGTGKEMWKIEASNAAFAIMPL